MNNTGKMVQANIQLDTISLVGFYIFGIYKLISTSGSRVQSAWINLYFVRSEQRESLVLAEMNT